MYINAQRHFKKTDPLLHKASLAHTIPDVRRSANLFRDIIRTIAGQQLSGKAADTIFGRLEALIGIGIGIRKSHRAFTPDTILQIPTLTLRECGFSQAKVNAIHNVARAVLDGAVNLEQLHTQQDAEVLASLTSIKGIGPWTAEMLLMFSLGREDIFSVGDLGLRKGIMYLYGLRKLPSETRMLRLAKCWSPYRTYAARILWRVADSKKVKSE